MLIQVTEEDILAGCRGHACYCPIALAIKRVIGRPIYVGVTHIYIKVAHKIIKPIPIKVESFVIQFDGVSDRALINPFEFELPIEEFCE